MSEKLLDFISSLTTAMTNCTLYSQDHPAVMLFSQKAVSLMDGIFADDSLSLTIIANRLMINDVPLSGSRIHLSNIIRKLKRKGIDKIVFSKGITAEELKGFITELALEDTISGAYPNISSGIIELKLREKDENVTKVMEENLSRVKEIYHDFSVSHRISIAELEEIVMSFVSTLKEEIDVMNLIRPIKSHSEYTFAHNANVAVLSIFQAEHLGMQNEVLHDVGLAGLLHDIGKMLISKEILEKETTLDDAEWEEMKNHPVYGALYLAKLPDTPKLAMIAAYEHHMKFDGSGYPSVLKGSEIQHIISQIISISDFFDALRTERPYRKALGIREICGMLKDGSGRDFNPFLVNNFLLALYKIRS